MRKAKNSVHTIIQFKFILTINEILNSCTNFTFIFSSPFKKKNRLKNALFIEMK